MEVLPADEEKAIIRSITDVAEANMKGGDTCYLLNGRWWKEWVEYVDQDTSIANKDNMAIVPRRPLAIDNSELVSDVKCENVTGELELVSTLMEGRDYILLPETVWDQFQK